MRPRALLRVVISAVFGASLVSIGPPAGAHSTPPIGRIAYVDTVDDHTAIFWMDPARPLTGVPLIDLGDRAPSEPAWSFDGTLIAFTAQTSSGGPNAVFVAKDDGSALRQLTFPGTGESDSDPSWSPSGGEIVFARALADGTSGLRIVNVASGDVRSLDFPSLRNASEPDWSPEGTRIAFVAKRSVDPSVCDSDPASCTSKLFVADADGAGEPRAINAPDEFEFHNPDWSPDATAVAVDFSSSLDPTIHLVLAFDVSTSNIVRTINANEPSWSPYDFSHIVVTVGSGASSIMVLDGGEQQSTFLGTGRQPAWGALPGVPAPRPPPFETTPPTIEFTFVTNEQGWLLGERGHVASEDPSGVSLYCTLDGRFLQSFYSLPGSTRAEGDLLFYGVAEGEHVVQCVASDVWNNQAVKSAWVKIDLTAPALGPISFDPKVRRVDETTDVAIPFVERGSGLKAASVVVGLGDHALRFALTPVDDVLNGTIGTSVPVGIWPLSATAVDNNGNRSSRTYVFDYLVVYDPTAGSTDGTGWLVPGGPTSDAYDSLPSLDGKTKASFSFKAAYRSSTSTTPTGFFDMSYGSDFKFQSDSLDWLVVTGSTAVLQGTAAIKGLSGTFLFRAQITDGASIGASDRLELRVWPAGSDPFRDTPRFQATGNAGGQIQIHS